RLRIERVDMDSPQPLPTVAQLTEAITWAGDFVTGLMHDWPEYPFSYGGVDASRPNRFPAAGSTDADAKRGRAATNMHWQLASDEALIISFDAHDGLWMLTNMGVFFDSMDFRYRPVSYTPSRTTVDSDGSVRIILAHRDPGFHNWMDTQGFECGNVTYRHMLDGQPAALHTRLVKHADLAGELPADTVRVTAEQRVAQMWERFNGIRRRYASL
ncbi:MAG: hypothetical protein SW019_09705, partial [Actinomycetota bacterium]|nr:hypothetical protein [Actinomycetota bacterium]